jgi:hypothetical protein
MRRCSTNSCAQEMSETCPSVAIIRRGRPASSTARCSLVVSPPRERPSACGPLFFEHRRMLVGSHDGRVDQHAFDLRLVGHRIRHAFPHTFATPSREAHVHRMPTAEFVRYIAPRAARSADPENRFDKPAIVGRRSTRIAFLAAVQTRFVPIRCRSITFESP